MKQYTPPKIVTSYSADELAKDAAVAVQYFSRPAPVERPGGPFRPSV